MAEKTYIFIYMGGTCPDDIEPHMELLTKDEILRRIKSTPELKGDHTMYAVVDGTVVCGFPQHLNPKSL